MALADISVRRDPRYARTVTGRCPINGCFGQQWYHRRCACRSGRVSSRSWVTVLSRVVLLLVGVRSAAGSTNTNLVQSLTAEDEAGANVFTAGSSSSFLTWARIRDSALQSSTFCKEGGCWVLVSPRQDVGAPRQTWAAVPPQDKLSKRFPSLVAAYKPKEQGIPYLRDRDPTWAALMDARARLATPRELCREHVWSEEAGQLQLIDNCSLKKCDLIENPPTES